MGPFGFQPLIAPNVWEMTHTHTEQMATTTTESVMNVFVYGSLLADDIVQAILKRVPPSTPAILHNYHRFSIKGRVYPAILPVQNNKVTGKVLLDITIPELNILDAFEDVEYERTTVDVSLTDGSKILKAETYVWVDKKNPDLYGEWDFEVWKQLHMGDFLKMTMGFREELELPESKTRVATYESYYAQEVNKSTT